MNIVSQEIPEKPKELDDNLAIRKLLTHFISQLMRGVKKPQLRISPSKVPELYQGNQEDIAFIWYVLKHLSTEYQLFEINYKNPEEFDRAKLKFNIEKEQTVRHWLNLFSSDTELVQWNKALTDVFQSQNINCSPLFNNPILIKGKTHREVISGFAKMEAILEEPITVRTLSAMCFWGLSKFLDSQPRQQLVKKLYPHLAHNLEDRALLINAYIPEGFEEVVFIENQDTFLLFSRDAGQYVPLQKIAFVYSSGFLGSAVRSRVQGSCIHSYLNTMTSEAKSQFNHWWFNMGDKPMKTYFWGDLDFSGMNILTALRQVFPLTTAWEPGYSLMVEHFMQGVHHSPEMAEKQNQQDQGDTGCDYADTQLLPLLRKTDSFLDQEIISVKMTAYVAGNKLDR